MIIALDTGGTSIRAALIEDSETLRTVSVACPADKSEHVVNQCIIDLISSIYTDGVTAIGAGVPAVVDTATGTLYNAVNIPAWREVHLRDLLHERFGVPVSVDNDCNCFAVGEHMYGAARGMRNVVGITLGTGVGAGLILDGKLYAGVMSGAGEIGSLPWRDSDYEHYCSSMYFRDFHHTTGAELAARAAAGDEAAIQAWRDFGRNLGHLVCAILFAYSPECIVIGGGIAGGWDLFMPGLEEVKGEFPYSPIADRCRVVRAALPNANLLGAAALAASL